MTHLPESVKDDGWESMTPIPSRETSTISTSIGSPAKMGFLQQTQQELDAAMKIVINSSYKDETRQHRLRKYKEKLVAAEVAIAYWKGAIAIEEAKEAAFLRQLAN